MGQVKKQYEEWLQQNHAIEMKNELEDTFKREWTQQFEQFIQQLMNTKFRDERSESGEDKHE
jgi:hypothetical protein